METKPFTFTSFEWQKEGEGCMAPGGEDFDSTEAI